MTATRVADASAARANGPAYAAFISYSRDADGRLAPRLEYALERFATPWYRLRAFRVFRDDASLSTNPGLRSALTGALDGVGYFILLASPEAAASVWVGREVEYWVEHRQRERILLVLTGGDIAWDESTGDFDWERTTALPRTISGAFTEEPRYTDLRFASHSGEVSVRDPRFRAAVADVAAPLHGIAKDDLIGEEVRQHKRTMRIARAAGIVLVLLAAVASVAAVLAVRSADRANRERDRAEREGRVATSRQLAAESTVALQANETDGALDRAATAWRTAKTSEARDAVLAALKGAGGVEAGFRGPPPGEAFGDHRMAVVSGDRRRVVLVGKQGDVTVLGLATGEAVGEPLALPRPDSIAGIAIDAHGQRLAVGYGHGKVDVWDLTRRSAQTIAHAPPKQTGPIPFVRDEGAYPEFSADGRRLAWGGRSRGIFVWDGQRVRRLESPEPPGDFGWDLALSGDGRFLAAAGASGSRMVVWRLDRASPPRVLPGGGPRFASVSDGDHGAIALGAGRRPVLAIGGADDGRVVLRDAATGRQLAARKLHLGQIDSIAFSPRGRVLAVIDSRAVTLLDHSGKALGAFPAAGAGYAAVPLDERGRTATIAATGAVLVRSPGAAERQFAQPLLGVSDTIGTLAFDPTGRRIATVDRASSLRLWNATGGQPVGAALARKLDAGEIRFLPDGRVATCCGSVGPSRIRVWAQDGGGPSSEAPASSPGQTYDMAVTPERRIVSVTYRGRRATVSGAGRPLVFAGDASVVLSQDGRWASVSTDKGDDVWDLDHRRKTASIPDSVAAFSPRGPLVAAGNGPIGLYDRRTGRKQGSMGDAGMVIDTLAFSPDGRTLATLGIVSGTGGTSRSSLELWDVASRRRAGREPLLVRNTDLYGELTFAPDGRRLALSADGPPPLVFDLDADHWAARACTLSSTCRGRPASGPAATDAP